MRLAQVSNIPPDLKKLFWSDDLSQLDTSAHQDYIILQVLEYGNTDELRWLLSQYGRKKIERTILYYNRSLRRQTRKFIEAIMLTKIDSV